MPDYSLGRAYGKIEIDYDGSGARRAERDLDAVTDSSDATDKSLTKTQRTVRDTSREMQSAGNSADGYSRRLHDVKQAASDVDAAERGLKATLLDSRASLDDVKDAEDRLSDARKRHVSATNAARDAHQALGGSLSGAERAGAALAKLMPNLSSSLRRVGDVSDEVGQQTSGLASKLGTVAAVVGVMGPQGRAAASGLMLLASGIDDASSSASKSSGLLGGLVDTIVSIETAVGKVGAIALGGTSLGGLAGLAGGASVQGAVNLAGAVKQLSGGLGLLPSVISAVELSSQSLSLAFRGVDDALTSMMSDDPKQFLEAIKDMGPIAQGAMLQVAQFRDQFKVAAAAPQESFFSQIAADIAPLIQTWLPAVAQAMSQIAGVFGEMAHEFAGLLMQPAAMAAFEQFVDNVSAGLRALQPALAPLMEIFTQLTVVGSSTFQVIGQQLTQMLTFFAQVTDRAAADGSLQTWMLEAVNGFGRIVNILYSAGSAFLNIMDIAEQFGGGGLLGWLDELAQQLNAWTQSADGQQALADFFATVRQATDAFLPILPPLLDGIVSIGKAFVGLGVATAPGWQSFMNSFAQSMAQLGPQIVGMGPALNQFLVNMGTALINLVTQVGPQLPGLFNVLSNAFSSLLPQLVPLVDIFMELAMQIGPMLPEFFGAVTRLIEALIPYVPILVGLFGDLVGVLTWFIGAGASVVGWFTNFLKAVGNFVGQVPQAFANVKNTIVKFFEQLGRDAVDWGKKIISGILSGLTDNALLNGLGGAAKRVVDTISSWFPQSPAKQGPFSGSGYTYVRGQKIVTDMAAGMASAQGAIASAAATTAATASNGLALSGGGAAAPSGRSTVGGSLLPDNIAGADQSILTEYLRHEFSDSHGLKGLAKSFGDIMNVAKGGFDLLNQHVVQPMLQAFGMLPGAQDQAWRKMSPAEIAAKEQQDLQKKATQDANKQGPTWGDVLGVDAPGAQTPGSSIPLGLNASSSKEDIQKAIIAAGKARGMNDGAIQTALAVAAAESGFDPTISGGVQGSAGLVSGLFQQSPSSGWGTLDQVNDPNYAINAFYDAYAKQLAKNPTDPLTAAVLTQNPQLGSDAQGSKYMGDVSNQLGLANSIMGAYGKDVKGPSWGMVTGNTTPATSTPQGTYGLRNGTDTGGYGTGTADVFPAWVMQLAEQFGVKPSTYADHQESDRGGEAGYAPNPQNLNRGIDWSGSVENMQKFADYLKQIAPNTPGLEQIIWENPNTGGRVGLGGAGNPTTGYYPDTGEGSYAEHRNHVHTRQSTPLPLTGDVGAVAAGQFAFTQPPTAVGGSAGQAGIVLPGGKTVDELLDATKQNTSVNDQMLQTYLQGNPALAQQITAAQTPGATDQVVMGTLDSITTTINGLKSQDAAANQNTITALQGQQTQIAKQQGFAQGPNALQQAQGIASGAGAAITGGFEVAANVLTSMAATQDIADRLVYGIRNTEDVGKIVDNVQNYLTLAASIASEVGNVMGLVGSILGAASASGAPGSGAGQAVSAAASVAQLVGGVIQGVNAGIDYAQQILEIAGGYVGRFMSNLAAFGGSPLMGQIGFLLNENTGQLMSYSMDNPEAKNTTNTPSWMNSWWDYNGRGNRNPQNNTQLNVYAGPGQSTAEMMNQTMWLVNTGGTAGAMAAAAF